VEQLSKNVKKIFEDEKVISKELNKNIKVKIPKNISNNFNHLSNNLEIKNLNFNIKRTSKFKFSKIENFNYFEPELVFDGNNFIYFDDKGNILKFGRDFKIIWKKNFYSKQEKKNKPILSFAVANNILIIFDNLSKLYAVDLVTGNLIWSKKNKNPFNSQIKIFDNKIYAIDMSNILRCYSLLDGSEIWQFKSEDTFLKSIKRNSLIIRNEKVFFNNSMGDITAIDAKNGSLLWQIPTQSSLIYENAFSLVMSDLVSDDKDIIFSNNRNEFYSLNLVNGFLNWKQKINSSVRPIFYDQFIFTMTGNVIRITDIFDIFGKNKRENIKPIGFVATLNQLILSTSNGRIIVIDIEDGKVDSIFKIDNEKISRPFIFDNKIILVKNDSIIRLN
jgi:outer membrane protein assembly factor BamB